jgi:hypothetical protein
MKKHPLSNIPDWMIIDAVRYCIGRMSYQVSTTTDWVCCNWKYLNEHTKTIVKNDLEEAFARDDRDRSIGGEYPNYALGHNCDRVEWERVRKLYQDATVL